MALGGRGFDLDAAREGWVRPQVYEEGLPLSAEGDRSFREGEGDPRNRPWMDSARSIDLERRVEVAGDGVHVGVEGRLEGDAQDEQGRGFKIRGWRRFAEQREPLLVLLQLCARGGIFRDLLPERLELLG